MRCGSIHIQKAVKRCKWKITRHSIIIWYKYLAKMVGENGKPFNIITFICESFILYVRALFLLRSSFWFTWIAITTPAKKREIRWKGVKKMNEDVPVLGYFGWSFFSLAFFFVIPVFCDGFCVFWLICLIFEFRLTGWELEESHQKPQHKHNYNTTNSLAYLYFDTFE